jgi:hypothetical protein
MTNVLSFAIWFLAAVGVVDENGCVPAVVNDAPAQSCMFAPPPQTDGEPTNTTPTTPRRPERRRISNGF